MIPYWVIDRKFAPGGACLVKRPLFQFPAKEPCPGCGTEMEKATFPGKHWVNSQQKYCCESCWKSKFEKQIVPYGHSSVMETYKRTMRQSHTSHISDEGNLKVDEYRFWVGVPMVMGTWSSCRACGQEALSPEARVLHKDWHGLPGQAYKYNCCQLLIKAYSKLLDGGKCVVCKQKAFGVKHFGVPICNNKCLVEWRFRSQQFPLLEEALAEVRLEVKSGG